MWCRFRQALSLLWLCALVAAQGCASDAAGPAPSPAGRPRVVERAAVTPPATQPVSHARPEAQSQPVAQGQPVAPAREYPPRFVIMERTGPGPKAVDKYGYIDAAGRVVIPPQFDAAREFSEGLALAQIGDRRAFIHTDGTLAFRLPGGGGEVGPFSEGLALVQVDTAAAGVAGGGRWGYAAPDGAFPVTPRFVRTQDAHKVLERSHFREGVAPFPDGNGKWGYLDRNGEWAVRPQFDSAMPFRDGLGAVHVDPPGGAVDPAVAPEGKWGYVDRGGKVVWMFDPGRRPAGTGQ